MALILYIDTASTHTQVVLATEDKILEEHIHDQANEQALMLNVIIDNMCKNNSIELSAIDAIALNGGPGSYTGLRVGFGVAKGICFALNKPLMIFNRLALLSLDLKEVLIMLKARAGEGFAFAKNNNETFFEAQHVFYNEFDWTAFETLNLLTDDDTLLSAHPKAIALASSIVNAAHWNTAAQSRFKQQAFNDIAYSEPFYLKEAFTTSPKNKIL